MLARMNADNGERINARESGDGWLVALMIPCDDKRVKSLLLTLGFTILYCPASIKKVC
jgi:glycine cleavage system H lipoate-binding protein